MYDIVQLFFFFFLSFAYKSRIYVILFCVTLEWKSLIHNGGADIVMYKLQYNNTRVIRKEKIYYVVVYHLPYFVQFKIGNEERKEEKDIYRYTMPRGQKRVFLVDFFLSLVTFYFFFLQKRRVFHN